MRQKGTKLKFGEFGGVLIRYASAQIVSNALRIISGFLVVRAVEPVLYGEFAGVGVYMGYILLGHGGIINGLTRELPYELGRKNDVYARELASSVYVLSLLLSLIGAIVFLIIGIYHLLSGHHLTGIIFLSYFLIGGFHLLNSLYLPALYRTNKDFDSLSKQNIKTGIGSLITVIFVYLFSVYGLIIRGIVLALYQFYLLYSNKPFKLQLTYKTEHLKQLFRTGFPIFLVGQVNPLWTTVLNTIIFSTGGAVNFGFYALSTIVQGAFGVIPAAFSGVIYPRMAIMYGEGKSAGEILKSNIRPLFFQLTILLFLAIISVLIMDPAINYFLPKYSSGIVAAKWMLFVPVAQSFGALSNIYNVVKRQFWYLVSLSTGAFVGSLFVYFQILHRGFHLEIFPQGILLGTIIQQILSLGFIKIIFRKEE